MLLSRLRDQRPTPWKNGGGTTVELFALPAGASLETFSLRLSRARVERAGPFSCFAGVDRSLVVLAGEGVQLRVHAPDARDAGPGAVEEVRLGAREAPFVFAGERAVDAWLLGGPIEDFNVMTRRSALRHQLAWLRLEAPQDARGDAAAKSLAARGDLVALVLVDGRLAIDGVTLEAGEAVLRAAHEGAAALRLDGERALALRVDVFAAPTVELATSRSRRSV